MSDIGNAGTFRLGEQTVKRMGYGAMQLAGPGVFGPPRDRAAAIRVATPRSRAQAPTASSWVRDHTTPPIRFWVFSTATSVVGG